MRKISHAGKLALAAKYSPLFQWVERAQHREILAKQGLQLMACRLPKETLNACDTCEDSHDKA